MFIPKEERITIYKTLFSDGVLVAHKNHHPTMHRELKLIPNLHVIKTMKSLVSKTFVKELYSWNHYYWTLNNDGIIYLRDYLHLSQQLVPSTLINRPRAVSNVGSCPPKDRGNRIPSIVEDRGIYRRSERLVGPSHKGDDAGAGNNDLVFRGGFERRSRNDEN